MLVKSHVQDPLTLRHAFAKTLHSQTYAAGQTATRYGHHYISIRERRIYIHACYHDLVPTFPWRSVHGREQSEKHVLKRYTKYSSPNEWVQPTLQTNLTLGKVVTDKMDPEAKAGSSWIGRWFG